MIEMLLGIICLLFVLALIFSSPQINNVNFFGFLALSLWGVLGLFIFFIGAKKVITDFLTNKKGVDSYGIVLSVSKTGIRINGVPEWEAEFITYIPSEHQTKIIKANIDCHFQVPYSKGDYLFLKQYKNDVNILHPISNDLIPSDILELLNNHYDRT